MAERDNGMFGRAVDRLPMDVDVAGDGAGDQDIARLLFDQVRQHSMGATKHAVDVDVQQRGPGIGIALSYLAGDVDAGVGEEHVESLAEVEEVVAHLKTQGVPEYLESITDEEEAGESSFESMVNGLDESNDLYDKAVAIVLRDGKASTSYVQRRLSIGYNRAASLIERIMQASGKFWCRRTMPDSGA